MITYQDLPAARAVAAQAYEVYVVGPQFTVEVIEGAYLDGLAAGREEAAGDFDYGRYVENLDAVAFIRRKVEEGRASLVDKQLVGFVRDVYAEYLEDFADLADVIERGGHCAAA